MKRFISCLLLVATSIALAAGSESTESSEPEVVASYEAAYALVQEERFEEALEMLLVLAEADSENADIHNLIAFSSHNLGMIEQGFEYYARALELDPLHVGAHEYVAELYIKTGDIAKAEEHLGVLQEICRVASETAESPDEAEGCHEVEEVLELLEHNQSEG